MTRVAALSVATRVAVSVVAVLIFAVVVVAAPARAQFLSPGALSKAHERIDNLGDCTKCHTSGSGLDNGSCMACHTEIKARVDGSRGYHARVKGQACNECHHEHRGRAVSLIQWPGGSRDAFNHELTGWALKEAHTKPSCLECHEPRRIEDKKVRELIVKEGRRTFLGLSQRCTTCHHDEHRGQLATDCTACHSQARFSPVATFDHNRQSQYPLQGRHKAVKCAECHESLTDTKPAPVFPERRAADYVKYTKIPHQTCTSCHEDVHNGELGTDCTQCHTVDDWKKVAGLIADTSFHDAHAFKLRGQHGSVACKACHGPTPTSPARYKGLKFARCADCHTDAHAAQLAATDGAVRCESCHDVSGFKPVRFSVADHDRTRYPLKDAHQVVACNQCHVQDKSLAAVDPKKRSALKLAGRKVLVSPMRLRWPELSSRSSTSSGPAVESAELACGVCHADVHDGQFLRPPPDEPARASRACASCHTTTSFLELRFSHDDTRFALRDKHATAPCASCHATGASGPTPTSDAAKATALGAPSPSASAPTTSTAVFRGTTGACASCHDDIHFGQFDGEGARNVGCASCHQTSSFAAIRFDHSTQSAFPLDGKHQETTCALCHPTGEVDGAALVRYKPVPSECATCHADVHQGAFDAFAQQTPAGGGRCASCHRTETWRGAPFAHERTQFPLTGQHVTVRCASCHGADTQRAQPTTCAGCHVDPHQQQFGLQCESCHSTSSFSAPRFAVDAHRASSFPLTGRHAALPCDECHVEKRDRTFSRAAVDCVSCHQKDAAAASLTTVDHGVRPFAGSSCRGCHVPTRFSPAQFAAHDACFPVSTGSHARVRCAECHAGLAGARFTGRCSTVPFFCTQCHEANAETARHADVPGFEFKDPKCYACHRTAR
jgi:hypothetical protein